LQNLDFNLQILGSKNVLNKLRTLSRHEIAEIKKSLHQKLSTMLSESFFLCLLSFGKRMVTPKEVLKADYERLYSLLIKNM
jgi:hypothetical protein